MAVPVVGILLDVTDLGGVPVTQGTAVLSSPVPLADAQDGVRVFAPVFAELGQVATIVPTDAPGPQPQGWACQIAFRNTLGAPVPYSFFVPAEACSVMIAAGSPAVLTWSPTSAYSSAGLVPLPNGTGVVLTGDDLPAAFTAGVTYWVTASSGDTYQLAATPGGTPIDAGTSGTGQVSVTQYRLSALVPVSLT